MNIHPILDPFLQDDQTLILDGGLATELEARGFDLNDPLWSAKILLENPEAIRQLHLDYLYAGADCIITATYQATFQGLIARGLSHAEAADCMLLAVRLATEARDQFWEDTSNHQIRGKARNRPLVAVSVGPYGAYLADGSEYRGDYELDTAGLINFHRERWHLLANAGADFHLCETIPSLIEAHAYFELAKETPGLKFALAFSGKNESEISDGTKIIDIFSAQFNSPNLIGVGINCTSPQFIAPLIQQFQNATDLPIIIYPNSGEDWDSANHQWTGTTHPEEFGTAVREWRRMGAAIIGGCCRTGPTHIRAISERLRSK
ncbi:MAG: homocysteine S-methyltransferase [Anaerolineae bacterium]